MRQLPLLFEYRRLLGREDFLVASCNIEVVEWIDAYPDWGTTSSIIVLGEEGAGKTHIGWLFCEKTEGRFYDSSEIKEYLFSDIVPINSALVIDNVDKIIGDVISEENLFHIINYALECGTKLLITMTKNPSKMNFAIPDLKTRILAMPIAKILHPMTNF